MTAFLFFFGPLLHRLHRKIATICTQPTATTIPISLDRRTRSLCKEGRLNEAVHMLYNVHGNLHSSTYVCLLQCCIRQNALYQGRRIHALILNRSETRFRKDVFLHNSLLQMYVKCGSLVDAREVFEGMMERDVFSWNVMIASYKKQGLSEEALSLFHEMLRDGNGVQPDEFTFASVVPACGSSKSVEEGVDIHRKIVRSGCQSDVAVVNALIDMYARFGNMNKARVLFDKTKDRNTISWNTMITGYAQNGLLEEAEKLFKKMHLKDTISWNAMIGGYVQNGLVEQAEKLFKEMDHKNMISWTAMIAGYAQNGLLNEAEKLFNEMPQRNTISWNAMIAGCAQNGHGLEALKLFENMQLCDLRPNSITFASILPVCGTFAALVRGMEIHGKTIKSGFLSHLVVITALIDMYAKCGSIHEAHVLFEKTHYRDTTLWTAMISGYAMHGYAKEAIQLFEQMKHLGISPDRVTFVSVLSACSQAGLVKEGCQYFNSMNEYYRITPTMEHYTCIVDLLGRAGCLDEAKDFIDNMLIKPDAFVWTCLLGACRIHNDLKLAKFVAERLLELDPQNSVPYVLLSNIYATSGRWNEIENLRKIMKDKGIQKLPGCSWIEVNKQVHTFVAGDRSHPKIQEIYAELERLSRVMKAEGYVPDTRFVLQDVKEEEKEQFLFYHSENLALAFGVLNTSPGATIRVVKNLRVCCNCHSATKFLSKILEREIIVRDANRYHHFKDGRCSCGDYW